MLTKTTSFKLKNALTELDALFQHIEQFGKSAGLPKKQIFQINLALDELFTNIVSYGYTDKNSHWIDFRLSLDILISLKLAKLKNFLEVKCGSHTN